MPKPASWPVFYSGKVLQITPRRIKLDASYLQVLNALGTMILICILCTIALHKYTCSISIRVFCGSQLMVPADMIRPECSEPDVTAIHPEIFIAFSTVSRQKLWSGINLALRVHYLPPQE